MISLRIYCIRENILRDLLEKERNVIMSSLLTEYDEEAVKEIWQEEAREEGLAEGLAMGVREVVIKLLSKRGQIKQEVLDIIVSEKSVETLNKWIELIMDTQSMQEFEERM